ncbi:hypothetical protein DFH07DRAFT_154246 [Mycena maculata]|uniref:Uncharacterized protein n=1 Tax=Mycena maculata TaxID=230809 RepID=A0AAD7MSS0_9AGAR|nr:hypothetical protein DFH07DRAFT_154246 [Mycena maculata]
MPLLTALKVFCIHLFQNFPPVMSFSAPPILSRLPNRPRTMAPVGTDPASSMDIAPPRPVRRHLLEVLTCNPEFAADVPPASWILPVSCLSLSWGRAERQSITTICRVGRRGRRR